MLIGTRILLNHYIYLLYTCIDNYRQFMFYKLQGDKVVIGKKLSDRKTEFFVYNEFMLMFYFYQSHTNTVYTHKYVYLIKS